MICPNCGKKIPDESLFCSECGAKIVQPEQRDDAVQNTAQTESQGAVQSADEGSGETNAGKSKSLNMKVIGGAVAAVLAVVAVLVFILTRKPTVNLNDYLIVSYEGYNGYGSATVQLDYDALDEKYAGKFKLNKKALCKQMGVEEDEWDELENFLNSSSDYLTESPSDDLAINILHEYFGMAGVGHLDKKEGLSNGDVITHTYNLSESDVEEFEEVFNCKLEADTKEYTVDGLEEVGSYDAFANIEVTYYGISSNATAEVENLATDEMGQELKYTVEPSEGLSNGDTITVKLSNAKEVSYYAEKYGKVPDTEEKTYTVDGLGSYLSTASDISDEALAEMDKRAQDKLANHVEDDWADSSKFLGATYVGNYFFSEPIKGSNYGKTGYYNRIYLCYRVDVENFGETTNVLYDEVNTYYTWYMFKDLTVSADGEISVDLDECETTYDTVTFKGSDDMWDSLQWYYYGYKDLDTLYEHECALKEKSYTVVEDNTSVPEDVEYEKSGFSDIPDDALSYEGHHYQRVRSRGISWTDAEARCEAKGGHLVTITSAEENNWLVNNFSISDTFHYWIGGQRDAAGNITWVTGEAATYANWTAAKTEFGVDEIYMRTSYPADTWTAVVNLEDDADHYLEGYIVEWDK